MQNGKYCESGLAYPYNKNGARCTSMKEMKWNGNVLDQPYACNPKELDIQCELYFDIYDGEMIMLRQLVRREIMLEISASVLWMGKLMTVNALSMKTKMTVLYLVKRITHCQCQKAIAQVSLDMNQPIKLTKHTPL